MSNTRLMRIITDEKMTLSRGELIPVKRVEVEPNCSSMKSKWPS